MSFEQASEPLGLELEEGVDERTQVYVGAPIAPQASAAGGALHVAP